MTKRTKRNHSDSFKAKVALMALRGKKTLIEMRRRGHCRNTAATLALFDAH